MWSWRSFILLFQEVHKCMHVKQLISFHSSLKLGLVKLSFLLLNLLIQILQFLFLVSNIFLSFFDFKLFIIKMFDFLKMKLNLLFRPARTPSKFLILDLCGYGLSLVAFSAPIAIIYLTTLSSSKHHE